MSLEDVRDLQSRLMLITGEAAKEKNDTKGKNDAKRKDDANDNVARFIKILSSVENLARTYVKLKTFGCSLFSNWSAKIK